MTLIAPRAEGCTPLIGVMVESHLSEGAQALKDPKDLKYGLSITDACLGWEVTERMLRNGAEILRKSAVARPTAAPVAATTI